MGIELHPEPIYHPFGGMNIDANGVTARPNEAIDAVNVEITAQSVVARHGTKALEKQAGLMGPVLKYHQYIHPERGALLFAFCANNIYRYDSSYGWVSIYFGAPFSGIEQWSVTNCIDKSYGATVVAAGSSYTLPTQPYADASDRILLIYDPDTGFEVIGFTVTATQYGNSYFTEGTIPDAGTDITIEFSIDSAVASAGGYLAGAGDSSDNGISMFWLGPVSNVMRVYIGGATKSVDVDMTFDTRYVLRATGAGDVYMNGSLIGNTGAVATGSIPFALFTDTPPAVDSIVSNEDLMTIYKYVIDGVTYVGHVDKYYYDIDDTTSRLFNRENTVPVSETYYTWVASSVDSRNFYLTVTQQTHDQAIPLYLPLDVKNSGVSLAGGAGNAAALLAVDEWDFGDFDTLGYDTMYVRLAGDVDPNTLARMDLIAYGNTTQSLNGYLENLDTGESVDIGFVDLELKKNVYADETYGVAIAAAAPPATNTWTLSADRKIVPGTAYLVVDGVGVIAVASLAIHNQTFGTSPNLVEQEVNFWIPVDDDEIEFGEASYIRLADGDISVNFLKNTYDTQDLTIYYQYEEDVVYRPLHVSNYHSALVMANTVEYFITDTATGNGTWRYTPWRVRWSEQGNIVLCKERNYQDLALDDISPILGMRALETAASSTIIGPLYFYKHNSIIRGSYNQGYNLDPALPVPMFSFDIAYSEGIEATNTIVNVEGKHFYLGRNDVYAFDGVNRVSLTQDLNTGSTRVQKYIFDNLNLDTLYRAFGVYDEISRKYYLFLSFNSAAGIYPEDCMVYDIDNNSWSRHTYNPISAGINLDANPGGAIDSLAGPIGTTDEGGDLPGLPGTIDSLTANKSKMLYFSIGDYTYYTIDTPIDEIDVNDIEFPAYVITRDFVGQTLEEQDRVQKVYIEALYGAIDVSYSCHYDTDPDEFLQENTLSFSDRYRIEHYNPDATTVAFRLKLALTGGAKFRWLQVFSNKQEFTNE